MPQNKGASADAETGSREPDTFSRHEVYDRAALIVDLWNSRVAEHTVVERDAELAALAETAGDAMSAFYQRAAEKLMPDEPK